MAAETYSTDAIAKLLAITPEHLRALEKSGDIEGRVGKNQWLLVPTVQSYVRYQRAIIEGRERKRQTSSQALAGKREEEIRLLRSRADLAELELAAKRREFIAFGAVVEAWQKVLTWLRQHFLTLPDRVAPRLLDCTTVAEVREVLREDITQALDEASRVDVQYRFDVAVRRGPGRPPASSRGDSRGAEPAGGSATAEH